MDTLTFSGIGKKVKVMFFDSGVTACFDETGQQIVDVQKKGWLELYLDYLQSKDIDIFNSEIIMPDGRKAKPFRTETGYEWLIVE